MTSTTSTRQSVLFGIEDWQKIYTAFREADFQSYDYQTLRKTMVDYLRNYYPEDFNDFIQSSEFIALIDLIAFLGHSISFRTDLNTRENFIDTAERRDSVLRLAKLVSYNPKRNIASNGVVKTDSISTTESVFDSSGNSLNTVPVFWNDTTNENWFEQFVAIINAAMISSEKFGNPASSQVINDIKTEEYNLQTPNDTLPLFGFSTNVDGTSTDFEFVSGTTLNETFIYEKEPKPADQFNVLYRNDGLGNSSVDTGFFLYLKQGSLQSIDFNIPEAIPNRIVNVEVFNLNENDVWLYSLDENDNPDVLWSRVPSVTGTNVIYNSITSTTRTVYSVTSREDDKIDLIFSDGVFGDIPVGNFRLYARQSNGLSQVVSPDELENIPVDIPYISREGRLETLTLNVSLQYTITNSRTRESLDEIRDNAPQQYYTQNRMITAEDYNIFPFATFSSITKIKSVNRTSSGISRYLDVKDPTGKYSSTNIFADDGLIYNEENNFDFTFTWITNNDIFNVIRNRIEPILRSVELKQYYHSKFARISFTSLPTNWSQTASQTNQSTGFFVNASSDPVKIGDSVTSNRKFLKAGALIKFTPPAGFHFMTDGTLMAGAADHPGSTDEIWATIVNVVGDGSNEGVGNLDDGTGPVTLSEIIPSTAEISEMIAPWVSDLPADIETIIVNNVIVNKDFGLRYNVDTQEWLEITDTNLNNSGTFTQNYEGDLSNQNLDNSWLLLFESDGETYEITYRDLSYFFESTLETRFYFEPDLKIFDPQTGRTIKDNIKVLQINTQPDSSDKLNVDKIIEIYDNVVELDGFVDDTKIKVTSADADNDGVPDNPDFFTELVEPSVNPNDKLIFWEKYVDANNFERWRPISQSLVNTDYTTFEAMNIDRSLFNDGQLFYTTEEEQFWTLVVGDSARTFTEETGFRTRIGRDDLYFQYKHNSPNTRRIDPSPANIIDLFILTSSYNVAYRKFVEDTTDTVSEPGLPTITELSNEYGSLNDFKAVSDTLVFNSAKFKPLFGVKADIELRASFKIVKNDRENITDNEVKTRLINAMNEYFDIQNWDFGDTFFASEMISFLHDELAPYAASIVLVPTNPAQQFGSLYQIVAEPDQLFISAATVADIEIIDAITATKIRAGGDFVSSTETSDVITDQALGGS